MAPAQRYVSSDQLRDLPALPAPASPSPQSCPPFIQGELTKGEPRASRSREKPGAVEVHTFTGKVPYARLCRLSGCQVAWPSARSHNVLSLSVLNAGGVLNQSHILTGTRQPLGGLRKRLHQTFPPAHEAGMQPHREPVPHAPQNQSPGYHHTMSGNCTPLLKSSWVSFPGTRN